MTEQSTAVATRAPKPTILAGGQVAALVPQSLDEAFRVASAIASSGLAPKGMDKPEQVLVAIMAGAELGFAPFQAMQSFAVINGKTNIWGDAIPALLWSSGFDIEEWFDDDDDPTKAFCKITRPNGKEVERSYSLEDAKKAALLGKQGPWQTAMKRMLQMRARAFAARDGASDVLRGMAVYEEVRDHQHVRDITPAKSGVMSRLPGATAAAGISAQAVEEGIATEQPLPPETIDAIIEETPSFDNAGETQAGVSEEGRTGQDGISSPGQDPSAQTSHTPSTTARDAPEEGQAPNSGAGGGEFDSLGWASELNQRLEADEFATVAALDAFTADPANIANFEALDRASPGVAKTLEAALKGRWKALSDRERG